MSQLFWTSLLMWSFINVFDIIVIKMLTFWSDFRSQFDDRWQSGLNKADLLGDKISTIHQGNVSIAAIQRYQLEILQTCTSYIRSVLLRAVNDQLGIAILNFRWWLNVEFYPKIFCSVKLITLVGDIIFVTFCESVKEIASWSSQNKKLHQNELMSKCKNLQISTIDDVSIQLLVILKK